MKASEYFKPKPRNPIDAMINRFASKEIIILGNKDVEPFVVDRQKILQNIIKEKENQIDQ